MSKTYEYYGTKKMTIQELESIGFFRTYRELINEDIKKGYGDIKENKVFIEHINTIENLINRLLKEANYTKKCEWCGNYFKPYRRTQKYCDIRCYEAVYRRKRKKEKAGVI